MFGGEGDRADCARLGKGGYSVPSIVEPDFILLVEKGTQWNRLFEDKVWRRYNCVLLTGNSRPPCGVRCLGYYIHSVVKQGWINPPSSFRRA